MRTDNQSRLGTRGTFHSLIFVSRKNVDVLKSGFCARGGCCHGDEARCSCQRARSPRDPGVELGVGDGVRTILNLGGGLGGGAGVLCSERFFYLSLGNSSICEEITGRRAQECKIWFGNFAKRFRTSFEMALTSNMTSIAVLSMTTGWQRLQFAERGGGITFKTLLLWGGGQLGKHTEGFARRDVCVIVDVLLQARRDV